MGDFGLFKKSAERDFNREANPLLYKQTSEAQRY